MTVWILYCIGRILENEKSLRMFYGNAEATIRRVLCVGDKGNHQVPTARHSTHPLTNYMRSAFQVAQVSIVYCNRIQGPLCPFWNILKDKSTLNDHIIPTNQPLSLLTYSFSQIRSTYILFTAVAMQSRIFIASNSVQISCFLTSLLCVLLYALFGELQNDN